MADQGFPVIRYDDRASPRERGRAHGESFRAGIRELTGIRKGLMAEANPAIHGAKLESLAAEQWEATRRFSPDLFAELDGIREGAGMPSSDLVVLNNYTDFRDIELPDEGCSTVFVEDKGGLLAGQTWDMHRSARSYVCVILIPGMEMDPAMAVFSLVGCLGLTGYNAEGGMVGVNNINTRKARPGILWPALVRETLRRRTHAAMEATLTDGYVTSGHNYLLASRSRAQMWEVSPEAREKVSEHRTGSEGRIFHTNHCLGAGNRALEIPRTVNSTTQDRFRLLEAKIGGVRDLDGLHAMLTDHDGFPKSICSHFQSNAKDPSFTCGGAAGELRSGTVRMWRGCPKEDRDHVERRFALRGGRFEEEASR